MVRRRRSQHSWGPQLDDSSCNQSETSRVTQYRLIAEYDIAHTHFVAVLSSENKQPQTAIWTRKNNKRVAPPSENHPPMWVACQRWFLPLAASPWLEAEQHIKNQATGLCVRTFALRISAAGPGADMKKNTIDAGNFIPAKEYLKLLEYLFRKLFSRRPHHITDPCPRFLVHVTGDVGLPCSAVGLPDGAVRLQFLKNHASESRKNCGSHDGQQQGFRLINHGAILVTGKGQDQSRRRPSPRPAGPA